MVFLYCHIILVYKLLLRERERERERESICVYKGSILCSKLVMVVYFFFRNESHYLRNKGEECINKINHGYL